MRIYHFKRIAQREWQNKFEFDFVNEYTKVLELENEIKLRFETVRGCMLATEMAAQASYTFEATPETNPGLYKRGLRTEPKYQSVLIHVLDIKRTCPIYASALSPRRAFDFVESSSFCQLNDILYNVRLISMAIEIIDGDKPLLPSGHLSIYAVKQIGEQTFQISTGIYKSFQVDELRIDLGFVSLQSQNGDCQYKRICKASLGRNNGGKPHGADAATTEQR